MIDGDSRLHQFMTGAFVKWFRTILIPSFPFSIFLMYGFCIYFALVYSSMFTQSILKSAFKAYEKKTMIMKYHTIISDVYNLTTKHIWLLEQVFDLITSKANIIKLDCTT